MAVRRVHDLQQDIRPAHFLERGAEGVHELVGQLVDEAHGVGQDGRLAIAKAHGPAGRVERREQPILCHRGLLAAEGIEHGALARIGVAHDGHAGHEPPVTGARRGLALAAHALDALAQLADALADDPPVGLELCLAGTAGADAAARAREVRPEACQAGQLVLELRKLDLEAPLVGAGMLREDVQDEPGAVEDLDPQDRLERLLLVGLELVVRHEQREAGLRPGLHELLRLALADVPVGVDVAAILPLGADHLRARGVGQAGQLGQRVLGVPTLVRAGIDGDQEGALRGRGEVDGDSAGHRDSGYPRRPDIDPGARARATPADQARGAGRRGARGRSGPWCAPPPASSG